MDLGGRSKYTGAPEKEHTEKGQSLRGEKDLRDLQGVCRHNG